MPFPSRRPRTRVYIDGFSFYYSASDDTLGVHGIFDAGAGCHYLRANEAPAQ